LISNNFSILFYLFRQTYYDQLNRLFVFYLIIILIIHFKNYDYFY